MSKIINLDDAAENVVNFVKQFRQDNSDDINSSIEEDIVEYVSHEFEFTNEEEDIVATFNSDDIDFTDAIADGKAGNYSEPRDIIAIEVMRRAFKLVGKPNHNVHLPN